MKTFEIDVNAMDAGSGKGNALQANPKQAEIKLLGVNGSGSPKTSETPPPPDDDSSLVVIRSPDPQGPPQSSGPTFFHANV